MQNYMERNVTVLTFLYFLLLFVFYRFHYYVPDFELYSGFQHNFGHFSKDGFSTLFVKISSLIAHYPASSFIIASMLFMASGFFAVNSLAFKYIGKNVNSVIVCIFVSSCGIWYYLSGKVYYDFPFTVFSLAITIYILLKAYFSETHKPVLFYLFGMACGFMLSWKPYNIFILSGLFSFILCDAKLRTLLLNILLSPLKLLKATILFALGYVLGNYSFLYSVEKTVLGISAYPAQSDFMTFLFDRDGKIWDHVNSLGYNYSNINVISLFIVAILIPVVTKRYLCLFLNIVNFVLFYNYIFRFSPGYPWHGFCYSLCVILGLISACQKSELLNALRKKILTCLLVGAAAAQVAVTFLYYIPQQAYWIEQDDETYNALRQKSFEIYGNVQTVAENLHGKVFVSCDFNRFITYRNGRKNKLIPAYQSDNPQAWEKLEREKFNSGDDTYIIRIVPSSMLYLANIYAIDMSGYSQISQTEYPGYSFYIYKKN